MGFKYQIDAFLENTYARIIAKNEALADCADDALAGLLETKRGELYHALAIDRLYELFPESKAFDIGSFTLQKEEKNDGYTLLRYTSETLPGLIAPFYVFMPDNPIADVALTFCCGHGNGAEEYTIPDDKVETEFYHKRFPIRAAKAGYIVCMSEFIAFGEMQRDEFQTPYTYETTCYPTITYLQECGLTALGVRVHQTFQTIAFAKTLAPKTYIAGISGGGTVTMLTSALHRGLEGACIMGYANSFKQSVLAMHHCICNFIPGILAIGEESEILSLAVPTPLMFTNGDKDDIFPVSAAQSCLGDVQKVYARFNAADDVELVVFAGEHEVDSASVLEWLDALVKK